MVIDALEPVPVAVPFDMIEQSEPKLLNELMLMPCSLFGVRAMMQPSEVVLVLVVVPVVVVVPCAATERARMVKPSFERPSQLTSTAPRLNFWVLVMITSTAPGAVVLAPLVGGSLTLTTTVLEPLIKPLRCASYCASVVMTVFEKLAARSTEPASAAASAALCICRLMRKSAPVSTTP